MFATVLNKKINYEITGKGDLKVFMVHGWTGTVKSLESLAGLLEPYATVTRLELPGRGESELPEKDWGVDEYAKLLVEFIKQQNLQNCVYFGHSFGGALGIYLSVNYPELIDKLIVCAPSYNRPTIAPSGNKQRLHKVFKLLNFLPPFVKRFYYKVMFPKSDLYSVPQLESNFRKIITQDLSPLVSKINKPTLILWGDKDAHVGLDDAYFLNKNISGSILKIYPDKTHGVPKTDPQLLFADIKGFLNI